MVNSTACKVDVDENLGIFFGRFEALAIFALP
jgi:hypothetical protein